MARIRIVTVWGIVAACIAGGASAGDQPAKAPDTPLLKVHLPRVQQVPPGELTVQAVCLVFGDDAEAVAGAEKVRLCRSPFSRERMRIDRELILGRLVASGFDRRQIRFTGSQHVIVTRDEREIDASRIVAAASALLARQSPPAGESRWRLTGQVEPITVEAGGPAELAPVIVTASQAQAAVRVDVLRDGKAAPGRKLTFAKEYLWRQTVARRDIAAGQSLTKADVAVETFYRPRPQPDWQAPYGKQAARAISAGTVLAPNLLTSPRPARVFERNAVVRIRVDLGGFTLLAKGLALSPGRVGETVRVQNIDSRRMLTARVRADGTVEPLLEETKR